MNRRFPIGDGAIMLKQSDKGICTVNLGNLLVGERARLQHQYAYLLSWQGDTVKFRLPTTIAPRYGGNWIQAGQVTTLLYLFLLLDGDNKNYQITVCA